MKNTLEKKLAIKITLASVTILFLVLSSIIGSSFIYTRNESYREFLWKVRSFSEWPRIIAEALWKKPVEREWPRVKGGRGPREIIIIDEVVGVLKNDILSLDEKGIKYLMSIQTDWVIETKIDGESFLINRQKVWSTSVFLLEDMERVYDFHIRLIIIALFGMILASTVIYILARYLAHITISPIREHNKDLEAYSHNVAHELRTPLSVVRSNMELLRIKPDEKYITSSEEEVGNMEHIIESLLFLAKPGIAKEKIKEIDIQKLTEECREKYQKSKDDIHIKVLKKWKVYGESELYKRMISNLIDNAIKYKSEWFIEITIEEWFIEIQNRVSENISQEQIEKLTKSFYQLDTSRYSDWYGLWLSLVEKIVKIFWWKMEISSHKKKFRVRISTL
jgi:two-component system, OmpR family, sensor histidine kinase CiaH